MQNEPFDKDYILKCCEGIYSEAFDANACIKILLQIGAYHRSGYKGTDCSPVFYYTVCSAMIRASIMDIARIYDEDSRSISLSNVNNYCNKYAASFPDFTTCKYEATDGTVDIEKYPLEYELTSEEIASEKSGTTLYEKIHEAQTLRQSCELKPSETLKLSVSAKEIFGLYGKRISRAESIINRVSTQRNKRYAHNDKDIAFDYDSLIKQNLVTFDEMSQLTDLALDYTITVIELLTGERKAREYYNLDDLSNTLELVRLGREYRKSVV